VFLMSADWAGWLRQICSADFGPENQKISHSASDIYQNQSICHVYAP